MSEEQSLIQSCVRQKRDAQQQLYRLLLPYLRAVATRYLRDTSYGKDVLQESFVKIFRSIEKYDPKKAPLKNWAARIVINTCLNYNDRVIGAPDEELNVEVHDHSELPEVLANLTDDRLLAILKKMPKGYFEVFNLHVIDGYNHQEIADLLGMTEGSSRKRLSRAKGWLERQRKVY
ncbi:MAG: RNA polymerase sigma factor (sigma-70 family) [Polaribacter sp.]|jgi:RNA polymerase sigma factor (sigma-70 family)